MNKKILWLFIAGLAACGEPVEKLPNGEDKLPADIINNPATASESASNDKIPAFQFTATRHHFGEIREGDVVSHGFDFKNAGQADLVIASVRASCGCTVPEYSREPVPAGKSGHIKVTFDSHGQHGMQSKTITVVANTVPATRVLTISADVLSDKNQ